MRWNPPSRPASRSTPVSRRAWRAMLTAPAWPHPVITTRPRPATFTTSAWSSRISGSGSQLPFAPGLVDGHALLEVGRAVDLAGDRARCRRAAATAGGARSPRSPRPPASSAAAWAAPSGPAAIDDPPAASTPAGGRSAGRRAAAQPGQAGEPAGVVEVAVAEHHGLDGRRRPCRGAPCCRPCRRATRRCRTGSVCDRSPRRTVTRAEKPCSATSPGTVLPPSKWGAGTGGVRPMAGAWPGPRRPSGRRSCCRPGW